MIKYSLYITMTTYFKKEKQMKHTPFQNYKKEAVEMDGRISYLARTSLFVKQEDCLHTGRKSMHWREFNEQELLNFWPLHQKVKGIITISKAHLITITIAEEGESPFESAGTGRREIRAECESGHLVRIP